jgi:sulfur-oxidizing protein SoxB
MLTEEAMFEDAAAFDPDTGHVFKPYVLREVGGKRIAVIGQAFPYTPIANPSRFIPDWTFGIRASELQGLIREIRSKHAVNALGGHTHDGVPKAMVINNSGGKTIVTNAGSNGKFLAVLDLEFGSSGVTDFRYRLLPVFSNLLEPDAEMDQYIANVRQPWQEKLNEPLATAEDLLYRRGNFNGTFDQVICDAQRAVGDAQIAFSPGFRWGTTVLPGDTVTMERVLEQTCITYPETYVREMTGEQIKLILEDVCDNLFNPDPFYQQGGDMVRVGGMDYVCEPKAGAGQRISEMTLNDGKPLDAGKTYRVAGWATVGSTAPGPPIWDVVAEYLKDRKSTGFTRLNTPVLKGLGENPGLAHPG